MDLTAVKRRKITPQEQKCRRDGALCMYCRDSSHFAASCPRKLRAASEQVEVIPSRDSGKEQEVEKTVENEVKSGTVEASAIRMVISLGTNLFCL
jgi:hypothetical protein